MEVLGQRWRNLMAATFFMPGIVGMAISTEPIYLIAMWRYLHIISCGMSLIVIVTSWWVKVTYIRTHVLALNYIICNQFNQFHSRLLPESPQWLLSKGRVEKAMEVLKNYMKYATPFSSSWSEDAGTSRASNNNDKVLKKLEDVGWIIADWLTVC